MAIDRFLIAPYKTGLQEDPEPWLSPEDAFITLNNVYIYRDRLKKRFGTRPMNILGSIARNVQQLYTRFRHNLGNTIASPSTHNVETLITQLKVGQQFSLNDDIFTIYQLGLDVNVHSTNPLITCTINSTVGPNMVTFTNAAAGIAVQYYPANPVMGLISYEGASINDERLYGFDTQFCYRFVADAWRREATEAAGGDSVWTGTNSQFFWGSNYIGSTASSYVLFVSNYTNADGIRYWNGTQWAKAAFTYDILAGLNLYNITTARIIVKFKDRLVLLSVVEEATLNNHVEYTNRCRYSATGSPLATDAFHEAPGTYGKGGQKDAPTREAITSAKFFKDRLIVSFERSTWELVYTGNHQDPFNWQRINSELGVESTFSTVQFDKAILGIANVGIHACDGTSVVRIDEKIPDNIFALHNDSDGVFRVHGIRDYKQEQVYWSYPNQDASVEQPYPNKILVYNYDIKSWARFDDSFTTFGYYQKTESITWADWTNPWTSYTDSWNSGALQSYYRDVVAGNQNGFVFVIEPEYAVSAPSIQITDIAVAGDVVTITAINHNLRANEYVYIDYALGITELNEKIYQIRNVNTTNHTFDITQTGIVTAYTGRGLIARVPEIDIMTKRFNFYINKGLKFMVPQIDCLVTATAAGVIDFDAYADFSIKSTIDNNVILGTGELETFPNITLSPFEQFQDKIWRSIYPSIEGETIQVRLKFNDVQMRDIDNYQSTFELHGMMFYAEPVSYRL